MSRCQKRGFYVAGFKVATGEAVAHLPDGPKRVVTTRAKPGEVNVQELPTGTLVDVPKVGLFAFDAREIHGRAGREVDLAAIAESLPEPTRLRWLRRVAVSRSDREAFRFVFGNERPTNRYLRRQELQTMMRACRAHWGELPELAVQPSLRENPYLLECAIPAIDDPALLVTLANLEEASSDITIAAISQLNALRCEDLAVQLARTAIFGLDSPSSAKYSRYGLQYDVSYALATFPEREFRELADEFLMNPSTTVAELFTLALNNAFIEARRPHAFGFKMKSPSPTGIASSLTSLQRTAAHVIELLRRQESADHAGRDVVERRITSISEELANFSTTTLPAIAHAEKSRDEISKMDTSALIQDAIVGTGPYGASDEVLFELASRHVVHPALLRDQRYIWVKALHDTGRFSRDEIVEKHFTAELRSGALAFLPHQALRGISRDAVEHPIVRLRALTLLDDLSLWTDIVLDREHDTRRRYYLEHTPLDVLARLCDLRAEEQAPHRDLFEIAIARGAVAPELGLRHPSSVVRRAAVARTDDQAAISNALNDEDASVARAAVAKCRDVAAINAVVQRHTGDHDDDTASLLRVAQRRLSQLSYHQLAEVSLSRGEPAVARAAIAELRHRDLLFDLLVEPSIAGFVAERLQQIQRAPRRRW